MGLNDLGGWRCGATRRARLIAGLCAALAGVVLQSALGPAPATASSAGPRAAITRLGPAPAGQRLDIVLPLAADEAGLERLAAAVSTVGSPEYGHYESLGSLARRFGASPAARAEVVAYLRAHGATGVQVDPTGLFADASMPVATAQRLFGTSLSGFRSAETGPFVAPSAQPRVPGPLRGAVTGVVGLDTRPLFGAPPLEVRHGAFAAHPALWRSQAAFRSDGSGYEPRTGTPAGCPQASASPQAGFTPNQYLTAFGLAPLQAQGLTGRGERVALIEIDGFHYGDLTTFASCFGLRVPRLEAFGVGIRRPLAPGGESTLDLEVLDAAAPGLKEIDVYESQSRAADVLRSLAAPLHNHGRTPQVISASLGACEPELVAAMGFAGIRAAEGALAEAAAAGVSVLASSGDAGSTECIGRSGPISALAQSYPASSPLVTGVGGTNVVLNSANQIASEVVWNDAPQGNGAGGGGPSALFNRPGFQNGWVTIRRRVTPDVSLLADPEPGYEIYCSATPVCVGPQNSSSWLPVGGTSAASPLFAGGIALIDQDLRANERPQLGQANPMLYRAAARSAPGSVYVDVTQGSNDLSPFIGDHRELGCCQAGPGFNWATGLGSPNVAALAAAAISLTAPVRVELSLPARQRPLARRALLARISCSRSCFVRVAAVIGGRGLRPFTVRTGILRFSRPGRHLVRVRLRGGDLARIRGESRRGAVYGSVYVELVDSGGNVVSVSRVRRTRIG